MNTSTPNPTRTPTTVDELFPRPWLTARDISKPTLVTIASADLVQVYDRESRGQVQRLALAFTVTDAQGNTRAASKRLIVNRTQAEKLAEITGARQFVAWVGTQVLLAPAKAHTGKPTIAIAAAPPPPAPPEP